jgi:hypothetical protein
MRKKKNILEMLEEYDFSGGVRGKYAKRYAAGTNVVVIDPDVAQALLPAKVISRPLPIWKSFCLALIRRRNQTANAVAPSFSFPSTRPPCASFAHK